jgi:RNA recognition motif-containing protein
MAFKNNTLAHEKCFIDNSNSGRNIFVGNLPWTVTSDDLALYFGTVGRVKSVNITRFPETGRSKGWG